MLGNPIVRKELIQAARRRRTYVSRVAFVGVAGVPLLLLLLLRAGLGEYWQDWREMASEGRFFFTQAAWMLLWILPLQAFNFTAMAFAREWQARTMEVLRVTALSSAGIVYGKLVGALSQVLMAGLALLPVIVVFHCVCGLPREVALGSFAIIVGTVLLGGSLGALQGAAVGPRQRTLSPPLTFFLLVLGALALLDRYVWVGYPLLEAAVLPKAFFLVLEEQALAGWSVGQFALLSVALLMAVSVLLLALAPALYDRTVARLMGTPERRTWSQRMRGRLAARRPAMKPEENPFFWQEKGPATRLLSWSVPAGYGVAALACVMIGFRQGSFRFLLQPLTYWAVPGIGSVVLMIGSAFYGARVFGREKRQHTAAALLLTGRPPWEFFWAKIRALYWAHRYSLAILGPVLVACFFLLPYPGNEWWLFVAVGLMVLVSCPGVSVLVGMVFGVVLSSAQQTVFALFLPLVALQVLGPFVTLAVLTPRDSPLGFAVIIGVIVILLAGFMRWKRQWSAWSISLMFAFWLAAFSVEIPLIASLLHGKGAGGAVLVVLSVFLLVAGFAYFWWRLGVSAFEEGMAQEPSSSLGALRA